MFEWWMLFAGLAVFVFGVFWGVSLGSHLDDVELDEKISRMTEVWRSVYVGRTRPIRLPEGVKLQLDPFWFQRTSPDEAMG